MPSYWDPIYKHTVYPIDAPPEASQRERDQFRQNLKRAGRLENGRCPYCGKFPEPGYVRCARCLERQRQAAARARERQRARRDAERRAAQPRRCSRCGGSRLTHREIRNGRQYYCCLDCGRSSFGDGPPIPPPSYPCPYCGAQCVKDGHSTRTARKPQMYRCRACGRQNTNLWPEDTPSPGGPFPHCIQFGLNYPALDALLIYCQEKKRSVAQAIREIFILAAKVPPPHSVASRSGGYRFKSPTIRAYLAAADARTAPPLPTIPPGEFRLPSANPATLAKLTEHRTGKFFNPTVLIARRVTVLLSDVALASLLEMMRRRHLNHQDTARALIAETQKPARKPTLIAIPRSDLDDGW